MPGKNEKKSDRIPDYPFGFNIIGFLTGNLGLGVAARTTVSILKETGYPFKVLDINPGGGRMAHDTSLLQYHTALDKPMPYAVNLYHMNPPETESALNVNHPLLRDWKTRMNVIVPFWELPKLPENWIDFIKKMDLILAPSRYLEGLLSTQVEGVPCRHFQQRIYNLARPVPDRQRWQFPENATIFLFSFDIASDVHRKNPLGAINAFHKAFQGSSNANLVIKLNNTNTGTYHASIAKKIIDICKVIPNIRIIDEVLSHEDVMQLYACADVYISLHRAEGHGQGMLESMYLGKPVIATAWSGNMEFMDDSNSCLVPCRFTKIHSSSVYIRYSENNADQFWAEPSEEDAVLWMRKLAENKNLRLKIGAAARNTAEKIIRETGSGRVFENVENFYLHWRETKSRGNPPTGNSPPAKPVEARPWKQREKFKPQNQSNCLTEFRVLFQNRADMLRLPGGDTTVVQELMTALKIKGVALGLSLEMSPALHEYNLIHLNNVSRSQDTLLQLRNAKSCGKAVAVFSLYEDMDKYLIPCTKQDLLYQSLINMDKIIPPTEFPELLEKIKLPSHPLDNRAARELGIGSFENQQYIFKNVDCILTTGPSETALIRSKFQPTAFFRELWMGFNRSFTQGDKSLFENHTGLSDFSICVGRIEPRKNQWVLIELFREMPDKQLVIIGSFQNPELEKAVKHRAPKNVHFYSRLSSELLASAFAAARVHVLPSWYELPGLVSLEAAAAGCRIVTTSWGSAKDYFGDRAHYCEPDNPQSIKSAVCEAYDSAITQDLHHYMLENFSWDRTAGIAESVYHEILNQDSPESPKYQSSEIGPLIKNPQPHGPVDAPTMSHQTAKLNIMSVIRPQWRSNPGGDTVLMQNISKALKAEGHTVFDSDSFAKPLPKMDLFHLFNATLPEFLDPVAEILRKAKIPFVVHALQEDWPKFLQQSRICAELLIAYVNDGQHGDPTSSLAQKLNAVAPSPVKTSPNALTWANRVICTGKEEAAVIKKISPGARVEILPVGVSDCFDKRHAIPDLFYSKYKVRDFVLCVGRLEPRKNQLMLLAALEEEDIPIVFVEGQTNYNVAYNNACKGFKRRGKTLFTGPLSEEMLLSAYASARVHCLPSWYELPGLVSLEAYRTGCPVVASPLGTLPDYLPAPACRYISPWDKDGLKSSVLTESRDENRHIPEVTISTTAEMVKRVLSLYWEVLTKKSEVT